MTGSVTLDIVISLVFIYLLYSLLATIIQEILATNILKLRAKVLKIAIQRMLDDDSGNTHFSDAFYSTPIIKYLAEKTGEHPSYLAARNFSKAILDLLKGSNPMPGEDFSKKIDQSLETKNGITLSSQSGNKVNTGESYTFLQSLWAEAHGDIERFKALLEQWFDDTMERASGWYKRKTQFILFFVGLAIAIIFNVDTISIVQKLSRDPKLTAQVVQQADNFTRAHPNLEAELKKRKEELGELKDGKDSALIKSSEKDYESLKATQKKLFNEADSLLKTDIKSVNGLLGIGIQSYEFKGTGFWKKVGFFLLSIVGWLITALALSLGAPFWFDLLNKLMKVRGSVATSSAPSGKETAAVNGKVINPKG